MTIEIHKPELERRMREGIQSGQFHDVDELLTKALDALFEKEAERGRELDAPSAQGTHSGAVLVEAMQASPYRDIDLQPQRDRLPVRDTVL